MPTSGFVTVTPPTEALLDIAGRYRDDIFWEAQSQACDSVLTKLTLPEVCDEVENVYFKLHHGKVIQGSS